MKITDTLKSEDQLCTTRVNTIFNLPQKFFHFLYSFNIIRHINKPVHMNSIQVHHQKQFYRIMLVTSKDDKIIYIFKTLIIRY